MGRYTVDLEDIIFEILLYIEMIINDKFYFNKNFILLRYEVDSTAEAVAQFTESAVCSAAKRR